MVVVNATQWKVEWAKNPRNGKKELCVQFWRPRAHVETLKGLCTFVPPTESVRFPGVLFYGHEVKVFKWGYDSERKTFFIWVQRKGGPVIVAPECAAYDGKSAMLPRKLFCEFKGCPNRVPNDQFPAPQRKPLKWPVGQR